MAVTDEKGSVVETYNYTPYGELIDGEYREDIPFLYNGQYGVVTDNNGLYYMRARYYNADIKRFINKDVLLGVLERISSSNRYAYVEGNPVSYLDPFGLEPVDTTAIHDMLTLISTFVGFISLLCPGDIMLTSISVALDAADIALSLYDLKCAINSNNNLQIYNSIYGIAKDIASIITTIVGFNIETAYERIINYNGWGGVYKYLPVAKADKELGDFYTNLAGGSIFVATIAKRLMQYFDLE
ncbi:MAG: RHS repeat-associated core domain-containing protein [Lachnospiraceae bacterium]|nr:RHS repeat-associated core domain-containing protein [Lachnospiraceae bacterium]